MVLVYSPASFLGGEGGELVRDGAQISLRFSINMYSVCIYRYTYISSNDYLFFIFII